MGGNDGITIKTISVKYGRKLGLKGYSSGNLEIDYWADIEDRVDPAEATKKLFDLARAMVREQAQPFLGALRQRLMLLADKLEPEMRKELYDLMNGEGNQDIDLLFAEVNRLAAGEENDDADRGTDN
jgi:hypothetical protein